MFKTSLLLAAATALLAGCSSDSDSQAAPVTTPGQDAQTSQDALAEASGDAQQEEAATKTQAEEVGSFVSLLLSMNYKLADKGIALDYGYVPAGLYPKPFIISFGNYLKQMTDGSLDIEAVNSYVVGDFVKYESGMIDDVANFYDPNSKFKDTWFGVYFIFDNEDGRARQFMLTDPAGSPSDTTNFKLDAIAQVPELDQKLISFMSHEKQDGYTWEVFSSEFVWEVTSLSAATTVQDMNAKDWLHVNAEANTTSALTDTSKTSMQFASGLRGMVGLPTAPVYAMVDPWHPIKVRGIGRSAYFDCGLSKFWAIAYFNGSAFSTKQGTQVDTVANTDLQAEYQKMWDKLSVSCVQ